jgi:ribosomal protein S14
MTVALVKTALTTAERCDRCGAKAKTLARKPFTGLNIMLCGHHGREHALALTEQGFVLLAVTHVSEA